MRVVLIDGASHVVRGNITIIGSALSFIDRHGRELIFSIYDVVEIQGA